MRIAVGAEPRRSTTDDTAKPNADPVGYQGTAAEDEQIADALDAIAAEYLTAPSVAEALRAYYSQDPTGAGRRQFDTWFRRAQPDVEIMPGDYNLVGRARDGGAFPIVDLDGVWAGLAQTASRDPFSVLPGERPVSMPSLLFELGRLAKGNSPIRAWSEQQNIRGKDNKVIGTKVDGDSRANVAWLLQRQKISVYYDEFSRRQAKWDGEARVAMRSLVTVVLENWHS